MEPSLSHKIRNSSIQLIVGIILVWLASWYLSNHPAEWQSIKSSVSTAREKIGQWVSSSGGESNKLAAQQKSQARSSLFEIIDTIKSCDPNISVAEYQLLYDTITTSSVEDFARNSTNYYAQISAAYQRMQEICDIVPSSLDE